VGDDHVHVGTNEFDRQFGQAREFALCPAVLDDHRRALDVAEIGKSLSDSPELVRKTRRGHGPEEADHLRVTHRKSSESTVEPSATPQRLASSLIKARRVER
jgi:hypothetical protein